MISPLPVYWFSAVHLLADTSIFIITWIGLSLIGIPGALVLGFIAGFLSFIPNVGAVLAGVLIVLASLGSSPVRHPRPRA